MLMLYNHMWWLKGHMKRKVWKGSSVELSFKMSTFEGEKSKETYWWKFKKILCNNIH